MPEVKHSVQAVIIGGGMYGCVIACHLAERFNLKRIALIEAESSLLQRASLNNQARVHNGYHYPRSYTTGYRSRVNLPRFVADWGDAVVQNFTKLYAIARQNSKVTAKQFERFCEEIGASYEPAQPGYSQLFNRRLIESVYEVEEYAFDASVLAGMASKDLQAHGVELHLSSRVEAVFRQTLAQEKGQKTGYHVKVTKTGEVTEIFNTDLVFNCTYSGLNQIGGDFQGLLTPLKHEVTEMALFEPPKMLKGIAITVMDGPFFSFMPYPARELCTLSHVRFTPHFNWRDERGLNPYDNLSAYHQQSRANRMLRDASRYLPCIADATYRDSLFEVKTVLVKNETDDGRPILFEEYPELPGFYSVLGGKIDNIYDILERMETCIKPLN